MKPGTDPHPCFCAFDVLMLNDVVLTNKTLEQRRKILFNDVFTQKEGWMMYTVYHEASSKCVFGALAALLLSCVLMSYVRSSKGGCCLTGRKSWMLSMTRWTKTKKALS